MSTSLILDGPTLTGNVSLCILFTCPSSCISPSLARSLFTCRLWQRPLQLTDHRRNQWMTLTFYPSHFNCHWMHFHSSDDSVTFSTLRLHWCFFFSLFFFFLFFSPHQTPSTLTTWNSVCTHSQLVFFFASSLLSLNSTLPSHAVYTFIHSLSNSYTLTRPPAISVTVENMASWRLSCYILPEMINHVF